MQQMAPASNRPICHEVQQQVALVCVAGTTFPGHSSRCTKSAMGGSGCICLPTSSHLGQSGGEVAPGWPNMPWFWDLVTMSSQIPLSLPFLPNLLTQPFNQIPHRNLTNLNLHSWLLERLQSRSRASLKQWQQELRLLKEDQPDQPMRQSGPFLQSGVSLIRWTSGHPPVKSVADFLMYQLRTGSYSPAPLMVTGQPLLINWEIHPSTSARRKISLVSWIVSIETGPKAGGESPSGTSHWSCTS